MAILTDRRTALQMMLEERRREASEPSTGLVGRLENVDLVLEEMRQETLDRVARALKQNEEGSYGYCFGCHREISEQRLRALPFVVLCDRCEAEAEHRGHLREASRRVRAKFDAQPLFRENHG